MKYPSQSQSTFRNCGISLWQSIVGAQARKEIEELGDSSPVDHYHDHRMVKAAAIHGEALLSSRRLLQVSCEPGVHFVDPIQLASLSMRAHVYADSLSKGYVPSHEEVLENIPVRCYSTEDRYFIGLCTSIYAYYNTKYGIKAFYKDWRKLSKTMEFGVVQKKLPANAKVGIIGDWATGLDDTKELLKGILRMQLDAVIHLGDIYYAGTPDIEYEGHKYPGECTINFLNIFKEAYKEIKKECSENGENFNPPPVFNLAGNHDYYCMGKGFFEMMPGLPQALGYDSDYLQEASYFQLKLEGDDWQFLAMDTGRNDYSVVNAVNPDVTGPILEPSEVTWHQNKMHTFPGKTILLSHHQLFSANTTINGGTSPSKTYFVNGHLYNYFSPFFKDKVHAWFWGHEHNLVGFQDGQLGLSKGRLVGNGGYQSNESFDHPDKINYPQIRVNPGFKVKRDSEEYLYHAACVIDFGNKDQVGNPLTQYFQMPSWGRTDNQPENTSLQPMPNIDEYLSAFVFNMFPYLPLNLKTNSNIKVNVYARGFWHDVGSTNNVGVSQLSFQFESEFGDYGDSISIGIIVVDNQQAKIQIKCNYNHYLLGDWKLDTKQMICQYEFGFMQVDDHLPFDNPEISYIKYTSDDHPDFELIQFQAPAVHHVAGIGDWNPSVTFKIKYNGTTYWIAVECMS